MNALFLRTNYPLSELSPIPEDIGGRILGAQRLVADQVAANDQKAEITPGQISVLDFSMKVRQPFDQIKNSNFAALHAHSFTDKDA
jgi:hypothetical protein